MQTIQRLIKAPLLKRARKVGLALARHWPWPVSVRISNGHRMFVDLRSGIGRGIYAKGEFDPAVFSPLREALHSGDTFLDIGVNIGFYSMLALDQIGPTGEVHAFEIDERPLHCLWKTISREGLRNLHLHETAVGDCDGEVGLNMHEDSGNSSVIKSGGARQVKMTTLDTWWRGARVKNIQAMKLDIEGAEMLALQGAKELLSTERPVIVCEADPELQKRFGYGPKQLLDQFAALRYRVEPLDGTWSPTVVAYPE
jgi:FkbM family methyltransferase